MREKIFALALQTNCAGKTKNGAGFRKNLSASVKINALKIN